MLLSGIVIVVLAGENAFSFALNKSGYTNDEDIRLVCCGEQANGTGFEGPEHLVSLDAIVKILKLLKLS